MPSSLRLKPKIKPSTKSSFPKSSNRKQISKIPSRTPKFDRNGEDKHKFSPNRSDSSKKNFLGPSDRNPRPGKRNFADDRESSHSEEEFEGRGRTRGGGRRWERSNKRSGDRREFVENFDRRGDRNVGGKKRVDFERDERDKEKVSSKDAVEVKCGEEEKGKEEEVEGKKREKFQSRVLDKSGKKVRVNRKAKEEASTKEASDRPKKKKRVIKIDPYDISNKRMDDSVTENEKVIEEEEISKNAQFRAIQPSPDILSFVEDNLLGRRRLIELQNAGYNTKISAPLDNIPFSTSKERERIEESVFRNKLEFFAAAKISSSFPPAVIPEIAFAGRSNVGKSSLLNSLTRQWGVVRTSDKPGLTQTINFFRLASKLCLVDLPGYGFAYAKEEVKDAWEELVKEYVSSRVGLQRVCLLIDTKWGMKARDHELVELMERSKTPYQIVLTKTDLVFPIDVARRAMQIQRDLKSNKSLVNPVAMVSSKSGAGIRSLRGVLSKLARFVKP